MDDDFDTADPEQTSPTPEQTAIQITGTGGPSSSSAKSGTTNAVDARKPSTFISSKKELLPFSQELNSYTQPTNGRGSHKYWTPLFFYGEGEDENEEDAEAAGAQPPGSTDLSAPAPTRTSATTRGTSVVAGLPSDPFGHEFSVEQDVMNRDCVEFCCGCKCGNRYHIKPKDAKQNALTEMYFCGNFLQ